VHFILYISEDKFNTGKNSEGCMKPSCCKPILELYTRVMYSRQLWLAGCRNCTLLSWIYMLQQSWRIQ